jgi:integrase
MADWARRDSHGSRDPHTWAQRLKTLRSFMRWLQQFEPRTEGRDDAIFGRLPERQAPHIYSEQEIIDLLAGARRRGLPLVDRQVHRVFGELRRELEWRNRGTHHAPRIHDLRHTFVVRRIVQWQAQGVDIDQAMLSLSTYVGHAMVTNTYWYLSAVPELMALAAGRFESFMSQAEVQDA